jgi:hypothetical protein
VTRGIFGSIRDEQQEDGEKLLEYYYTGSKKERTEK